LPDSIFYTKNPNLGKFWRVLEWKMLAYFIAIWYIFRQFGIYFVAIRYILLLFGNVFKFWEKSGNPGWQLCSFPDCEIIYVHD
jgi:hypothetical protein